MPAREREKIDLEWVFNQYSIAFLQDMATALTALQHDNPTISIGDIVAFSKKKFSEWRSLEYENAKTIERREFEFNSKLRRCELCGNRMNLFPVNHSPCAQVGGGYKSAWECSSIFNCGEVIYSSLSVTEQARQFGLEGFFRDPADPAPPPDDPKGSKREQRAKASRQAQRRGATTSTQARPCGGCNK